MKKLLFFLLVLALSSSVGETVDFKSGTVVLSGDTLALAVDLNNPFDPTINQLTRFVFTSKGKDRTVQLRVFTVSGELVQEWPEQTASQDVVYTQDWDGKNFAGDIVARGMYLVNLKDSAEPRGVTRRLAVIKQP